MHIFFMCEIYIMLSLSANLSSGYTGLLSFANAAFYGLGAYVTALCLKKLSLTFFPSLLIAILFNMVASSIITFLSMKLKELYFTLATLSFQVIVFSILYNWENVTGGSYGITAIPSATILGYSFTTTASYTFLAAIFLLAIFSFFLFFRRRPFFDLLECIRDTELGVVSLGKNVFTARLVCNAISCSFMAVAGALFAVYNSYIDATSFTLNESILIISMILIGGMGNIKGPVLGACFYVMLPEIIRLMPIDSYKGACLQTIIYSITLIFIVRIKPNGIWGKFKFN